MYDSPFDHITDSTHYFDTPQLQDVFQSVLAEIENKRLLSCVIRFPKSGKTAFLNRIKAAAGIHAITLVASPEKNIAQMLTIRPQGDEKPSLSGLLREKQRVLMLIDNAHLLTDDDFALISSLFVLAQNQNNLLQVVLIGNGEIVHRLARPGNRAMYNLLSAIWNLPKLTREQSLAYVRALLDGAGLAQDMITNPETLVKRAAGVIGILRMLTITLALKALSSQDSCDATETLNPDCASREGDGLGDELPTQKMVTATSPWAAGLLAMSMGAIIIAFVLFFLWLTPGTSVKSVVSNFFHGAASGPEQTGVPPAKIAPASPVSQEVAKTVFRKRTKDGPYSLQLGSYPTMESLLLHLPRFTNLKQPLFWNRDDLERFMLFTGRFESFDQAGFFANENQLAGSPVVFRPYVATAGPLTDPEQLRQASLALGLQGQVTAFEYELVNGVEIQIALERTREDALERCAGAEKMGLSCAVTQYE